MSDTVLICGGGGALGSAVAAACLARGDRVEIADVGASSGPPVDGVRRHSLDLTAPNEVDALWERLVGDGHVPRWVVNVAGGFREGTVAESRPASVAFVESLNLETAWWSCRAAARNLPAGGGIVNVGARTAIQGGAGAAAYAVAKAGVVRLTQVLADELREQGIRSNAILPAIIDTPANRASLPPEALEKAVVPAEIASVVAFLLSDAAAAVTGAIIPVYGFA